MELPDRFSWIDGPFPADDWTILVEYPHKAKSVYLDKRGITEARALLAEYGINDE